VTEDHTTRALALVERLLEQANGPPFSVSLYREAASLIRSLLEALDEALRAHQCCCEEHERDIALRQAAEAEREALREALADAAKTFRQYEVLHREKRTVDGEQKAVANGVKAQRIEDLLAALFTREMEHG
jgi:hypothetical protein